MQPSSDDLKFPAHNSATPLSCLYDKGVRTNTGHCLYGRSFARPHSSLSPRTCGQTKGGILHLSYRSQTKLVYNRKTLQCNKNAALVFNPTPVSFTRDHRGRFTSPDFEALYMSQKSPSWERLELQTPSGRRGYAEGFLINPVINLHADSLVGHICCNSIRSHKTFTWLCSYITDTIYFGD